MKLAIALLVCLVAATSLLAGREATLLVAEDSERDFARTMVMVRHGTWPEHGPTATRLPISLGRLWYVVIAPVVAFDPSPVAVHRLHVGALLLAVGWWIVVLARGVGTPAAGLAGLLAVTSVYVFDSYHYVWHAGLVPCVAFLWLATLLSGPLTVARASALLLLSLLGLQLHLVMGVYVCSSLAVLAMTLRTARHDVVSRTLLLLGMGWMSFELYSLLGAGPALLDALTARRGAVDTGAAAVTALISLTNAWLPADALVIATSMVAALAGARAAWATPPGRVLLATLALGSIFAALATRHAGQVRYLHGVLPVFYTLVGYGLSAVARGARARPQRAAIPAGAVALIWLLVPSDPKPEPVAGPLTVLEREAALRTLRTELGVTCADLYERVHGELFLSGGTSYLALAGGLCPPASDGPGEGAPPVLVTRDRALTAGAARVATISVGDRPPVFLAQLAAGIEGPRWQVGDGTSGPEYRSQALHHPRTSRSTLVRLGIPQAALTGSTFHRVTLQLGAAGPAPARLIVSTEDPAPISVVAVTADGRTAPLSPSLTDGPSPHPLWLLPEQPADGMIEIESAAPIRYVSVF